MKGGLVRSILFPKPNKFKFYQDSFRFITFIGFLGKALALGIERNMKKMIPDLK